MENSIDETDEYIFYLKNIKDSNKKINGLKIDKLIESLEEIKNDINTKYHEVNKVYYRTYGPSYLKSPVTFVKVSELYIKYNNIYITGISICGDGDDGNTSTTYTICNYKDYNFCNEQDFKNLWKELDLFDTDNQYYTKLYKKLWTRVKELAEDNSK